MNRDFTEIYNRFSEALRKFIRGAVKDSDAADDIFQEVLLKIHSHLDSLNDEERLAAWIFKVARNAINDHYRSSRLTTEFDDTLPASEENTGAEPSDQILSYMKYLVEILPEPYRRAIIQTEFEGLSQKELAAKEGISLSGAKSRVQRARGMLKEMLLECCHFELDARKHIIGYQPNCSCCKSGCAPEK
ncbi:MAG: RNA polymerase sigma factor SigZ [Candidatus Zixiibacteriota bacterium]